MSNFTFSKAGFDKIAAMTKGDGPVALFGISAWAETGGWLTKTDATEHIYGSSGRGSPKAIGILDAFATYGVLERLKKGRVTYYRAPKELLDALRAHPKWNAEYDNNLACEKRFIAEGIRPRPRV